MFLQEQNDNLLTFKIAAERIFPPLILLAKNKSKDISGLIESVQNSNVFQTWRFAGRMHKAFHRFVCLDRYDTIHSLFRL